MEKKKTRKKENRIQKERGFMVQAPIHHSQKTPASPGEQSISPVTPGTLDTSLMLTFQGSNCAHNTL